MRTSDSAALPAPQHLESGMNQPLAVHALDAARRVDDNDLGRATVRPAHGHNVLSIRRPARLAPLLVGTAGGDGGDESAVRGDDREARAGRQRIDGDDQPFLRQFLHELIAVLGAFAK